MTSPSDGAPTFDFSDLFPHIVVYEADGWSAVFVNGTRVQVGDSYLADEKIREIFSVTTIQSADFLMGGNGTGRNGTPPPAQTLAEVEAYTAQRLDRQERATTLRDQAAALLSEANALEGK